MSGNTYDVQQSTGLGARPWTTVQTLPGDGTAKTISLPVSETSATFRVQTR